MSIRILAARLISQFGDLTFNAVFDLWILQLFGSTHVLAQSLMIASLANFLASLFGGYLADSNHLFKATLLMQSLSCGISLIGFLLFSHGHTELIAINTILFTLNFSNYTFSPIMKKIIHTGIEMKNIAKFNQRLNLFGQILTVLTPSLSVWFYSQQLISLPYVLLINACSFFISLLLLLPIRKRIQPRKAKENNSYKAAFQYVRQDSRLRQLIFYGFLLSCYGAQLNVFLPAYYVQIKGDSNQYAFVLLLTAIVGIIAALTYPLFQKKMLQKLLIPLFIPVIIALPASLFLDWLLYLVIIITNIFMVHFAIASQNIIQLTADPKQLGKVFSLLFVALNLAMPLGHYIAGQASQYSLSIMVASLTITFILLFVARLLLDKSTKNAPE